MKTKYQDYPQGVQRASIMQAHSEGTEEKIILKPLSHEELIALDKELAEHAVELAGHNEILDAAKAKHKADTAQLKENYGYILAKIRRKGEEVNARLHKFFNHEEMTVELYDDDGVFVEARAMTPQEKNAILSAGRTAPIVRPLAVNE